MDEEDWREARKNADVDDCRPDSGTLKELREGDLPPVRELPENEDWETVREPTDVQCDECGRMLAPDDPAHSVIWRERTPQGIGEHGSCWLCDECLSILPGQ